MGGAGQMSKTIVYAGGFWSTNIGNAFYGLGCLHALSKACPDANIISAQNQPGYFWQINKANPKNAFDYLGCINAEYFVMSGPMIDKHFVSYWGESLIKIAERGAKLILLSVGCGSYDEQEKRIVRKFMKEIGLHAIITRDTYTYENYGDLAAHSHDGICFAFFVNDYFKPYGLDVKPYVVFNCDRMPEPIFVESVNNQSGLSLFGKEWQCKLKNIPEYIYKGIAFLNVDVNKPYQHSFSGYEIIRTRHAAQPSAAKKLFAAPNTLVSDVPDDYLNIYANAEAVLSDRVHACVPALAFGKPAMFFGNTPRSRLFDRVGLGDIRKRPVTISQDYLRAEKDDLLKFIGNII